MTLAVTTFRLQAGRTLEDYRRFSRETIGPGMLQMPSVTGFLDGTALGAMGGGAVHWDGLEVITITSPERFEADHEVAPGTNVAAAWLEWIEHYQVTYVETIHGG